VVPWRLEAGDAEPRSRPPVRGQRPPAADGLVQRVRQPPGSSASCPGTRCRCSPRPREALRA